ncbi:hypothetical protein F2Q69_00044149 [Brassica cretica]|uniref:Uncharacterized protein n=1 Tax=Brassica cretica TaxID=69181 RepID=A0A8S9NW56_BRACR|nr:hypothetical protein F2Q69_00044149 [Brassica cretica]
MYEKAWTNESTTKSHGVNSLGAHPINSEVGCFNSEDGDDFSTPLMDSVMVRDAFCKSLSDMEIIGNTHQLYDRKSLRATGGKGKGLTGLLPRIRVCEPGGVLTKLAKWNGLDTCHEDGWLRRVIQRCVGNVTNLPFDLEGIVCPTKCSAVVV